MWNLTLSGKQTSNQQLHFSSQCLCIYHDGRRGSSRGSFVPLWVCTGCSCCWWMWPVEHLLSFLVLMKNSGSCFITSEANHVSNQCTFTPFSLALSPFLVLSLTHSSVYLLLFTLPLSQSFTLSYSLSLSSPTNLICHMTYESCTPGFSCRSNAMVTVW